MIVKLGYVILLVTALLFAQNQIRISGTVTDKSTNSPISGATVKLLGRNVSAQTGADGTFLITGTAVTNRSIIAQASAHYIDRDRVFFSLSYDQNVQIAIHDLHGRLAKVLFSGMMKAGASSMQLPVLPDGVYVCMIKTSENTYSTRFLSQSQMNSVAYNEHLSSAEGNSGLIKSAAAMAVDSIVVSKTGYTQSVVAIDSFEKSDLAIQLAPEGGSLDNTTIVPDPSWTCFMPNGIPPPELGTKVFSIQMKYQTKYEVGKTKFGTRRFFIVNSGTVDGSKLKGTLYSGGLDFELTLSNGSTELEQIIIIKTNDNKPILMRNAGVAPSGSSNAVRVVLDFEAPNSSSYTWLHTGKFAATRIVDTVGKTISMDVYDITSVTLPSTKVQIKDPAGVTNQTWECLQFTGTKGTNVITENVECTGQISIGATKGGSRNIIPITGGTTTGKVVGKILNAGADYQMGGLDARYVLAPNDGEFIIIRNCGANGLVPVFEARVDGNYNFLNENKYLSDGPVVTTTSTGMIVKILLWEMK
jgi:hypothetical protein